MCECVTKLKQNWCHYREARLIVDACLCTSSNRLVVTMEARPFVDVCFWCSLSRPVVTTEDRPFCECATSQSKETLEKEYRDLFVFLFVYGLLPFRFLHTASTLQSMYARNACDVVCIIFENFEHKYACNKWRGKFSRIMSVVELTKGSGSMWHTYIDDHHSLSQYLGKYSKAFLTLWIFNKITCWSRAN